MEMSAPRLPAERHAGFDRYGGEGGAPPPSPVVISVPHAGRDYSASLLAQARVPPTTLRRLEDRYADLLVHPLIARGEAVIVARQPRALIDLNRDEREIDTTIVRDVPHGQPVIGSGKLRGGLGLLPRRLQGAGELWLHALEWQDVARRIGDVHRPYHAALATMMQRARAAHGHAILVDIHSMPPLPDIGEHPVARVVLGDRFGRSAANRLVTLAADLCAGRGVPAAQNHPYPGNHILDRHGRPERNLHALQVEVDRSLYLDHALAAPGEGLAVVQALIADLVEALADELPRADYATAAE